MLLSQSGAARGMCACRVEKEFELLQASNARVRLGGESCAATAARGRSLPVVSLDVITRETPDRGARREGRTHICARDREQCASEVERKTVNT